MTAAEITAVLEATPWLLYGATLAFGLAIGSFLNVVILRLPKMMAADWRRECTELLASDDERPDETSGDGDAAADGDRTASEAEALSLARPPSHCPSCGARIRVRDNIPILSWLLLRGRCRDCQAPISSRYPLVEGLTAILSLIVIWQFGPTAQGLAALVLTWGLIALALIDLDTQLLPDDITLPLLWLGLLLALGNVFVDSSEAIVGAAAGYLGLWLVFHGFKLLTGREGMGRGDFKLLAVFGAWLGWQALPQIILLSAVPGAIVGVALIASGRQQAGQPIPYGPFLAIAGWVVLLWGDAILAAYLRWAGIA